MVADGDDQRARPDPGAGRGGGIEVIQRAAAGVAAAERVAGRAPGAFGDGLVKLSVGDGGEGVGLVDDAGDRVREGGMAHAVEHDRADRDLAVIGLAARLGGNDARQEILVSLSAAFLPSSARRRDAEGGERGIADLAVDGEAVFALEIAHG